jgi:hypothetical protein
MVAYWMGDILMPQLPVIIGMAEGEPGQIDKFFNEVLPAAFKKLD